MRRIRHFPFQRGRTPSYRLWDPYGYPRVALRRVIEGRVRALALDPGARVLDFGCGVQPYRDVFGAAVEYVGADLPGNQLADVSIIDGVVAVPDASFDVVISTQVLEHVPDPPAYLAECRRVLRPGGHLLLSTHGVMFYHPHPTDLWRWTTDGLSDLFATARLQVLSIESVIGAVPLGLWLVMLNVQIKLPPGIRHAVVSLFNLLIQWSDRGDWKIFRADYVYVVDARAEAPGEGRVCASTARRPRRNESPLGSRP